MSKGLEDLKWLIENGYIEQHGWQEDIVMLDCVDNIEKELKEYKEYEQILSDYGLNLCNFREACLLLAMLKGSGRNIHDIGKQLKAFDIIKKRTSDLLKRCMLDEIPNQEEYDLLKEALR